VPDPFPVIEQHKDLNLTIQQLQIENKDLKETLTAYNNEINLMNNKEVIIIIVINFIQFNLISFYLYIVKTVRRR